MCKTHFCCAIACGLLLAAPGALRSQPLTINTLAGCAAQGSADGTGSNARFYQPQGVAADTAGNVYVADTWNHTIRQITSAGVVSTLAGAPGTNGVADGTGSGARFYQPRGVAVDNSGNLYVADTGNHTIRKIVSGGVVTTLAGSPGSPGSADGSGTSARFYQPEGIAVDLSGNIYVADTWNHTIRKVTTAGVVTTLAGSAGSYGSADGTGSGAQFYQPRGIAVDASGNVFVGDTANSAIRMVTAGGVVSTLAGSAGTYGSADGTGSSAQFYGPQGVAVDNTGNVYVADYFNHTIRKVTSSGVVSTLAGLAGSYGTADATGTGARFYGPQGVAVSGTNVYVADTGNGTIRKVTSSGAVSTLAGSASTGSADGTGGSARFYWPAGVTLDSATNLYVADTENGTIRKATPAGVVTTLAGSAGNYGSTDATGSSARFYGPQAVAADTSGTLYVADTANHTIRKVTSAGVVSTLAGSPGVNGITDGASGSARFNWPAGVAVDGARTVYVADTWNHTIRKVTSAGVVSTLAGFPGSYGCSDGTGGNVGTNTARFDCPAGVALDSATNVYVADCFNHTIRRITPAGLVSTLAGLPGVWGNADGTNTDARFFGPRGVAVDSAGNVYVMDAGNHTVRKLAPVGTNWVVSTVAGLPVVSGSSDGMGSNARFYWPAGITVNGAGSFYMADLGNNTLRSGWLSTNGAVAITHQPQSQTVDQGVDVTFSVAVSGAAPFYYQWRFNTTSIAGATASSYTRASVQPGDAGTYSVGVNNQINDVTSSDATLTVNPLPVITNQPVSLTRTQGSTATFSVTAGPAPVTCQWQKAGVNLINGGNISDADSTTLTINNTTPTDAAGYTAVLGNTVGSVTSIVATLTVLVPSTILAQPQSQIVPIGTDVTLSVTAIGTAPLGYKWQFNGADLGGTASSYLLGNVHPNKTGSYTVIVSNAVAVVTSAVATLAVLNPPSIVAPPQSQTVTQGSSVTFAVTAIGSDPLSYEWQRNGTNLSDGGALSGTAFATLTINNVAAGDAGSYAVLVSNAVGSATSGVALLNVVASAPARFESISLLSDGSVQLGMSGAPAAGYLLEYSSNWVDWASLSSLTGTDGLFQYRDLSATNDTQRFYRLRLGP